MFFMHLSALSNVATNMFNVTDLSPASKLGGHMEVNILQWNRIALKEISLP